MALDDWRPPEEWPRLMTIDAYAVGEPFRHGFVTRSLKAGIDSHTVAKLAGHQDTRMIDKVYSHVSDDSDYMLKQAQRSC